MSRPTPAVLAEDLRALAEVVPFDAKTTEILETAADYLERLSAICGSTVDYPDRDTTRVAVCDLPPGHGDEHQQSGGPVWNNARELL